MNFQVKMPDEQAQRLNDVLNSVVSKLGDGATRATALDMLYPAMLAAAETTVRPDTAPYVAAISEACNSILAHADALAKAYADYENAAETISQNNLSSLKKALEEAQSQRDEALERASKAEALNTQSSKALIDAIRTLKNENASLSARVKELEANEKGFDELKELIVGLSASYDEK